MSRNQDDLEKKMICPSTMLNIVARAGYVPAVRVDRLVFCAGQVGRDADLRVIEDPEAQFYQCWKNLRSVLAEAGCSFDDVVEMTTYHVDMRRNMDLFRRIKDEVFPRSSCAWTCIGVAELAVEGLLVEIKCVALRPNISQPGAASAS